MQKAEVSRHVLGFECRGFVILCFIKLKVLMCSVVSLECCLHCSTQKWSDYLLSSLQKHKWRLFQLTCLQEVACKKSSKISHRVLIDLDLRGEHPGDRFYENLSGLMCRTATFQIDNIDHWRTLQGPMINLVASISFTTTLVYFEKSLR